MNKKKLIFHVGLPKTATTSLQTFFQENQSLLAEQGFAYPAADLTIAAPKQQFMLRALLTGKFETLQKTISETPQPTIILSTEGLTNHLYDFKEHNLASFRNILKEYHTTGLIVLREPYKWARSYYKQSLINGPVNIVDFYATDLTFDDFLKHPRIVQLTKQSQVIEDVKAAYGFDDMIVVNFEDDWFKHICENLGLSFPSGYAPSQIHISPPSWTSEVLRQINTYKLPNPERDTWKLALQEFTQSQHVNLRSLTQDNNAPYRLNKEIVEKLHPHQDQHFSLSQKELTEFINFLKTNDGISA